MQTLIAINTDHFDRMEYFKVGESSGFVTVPALGYCKVSEQVLTSFNSSQTIECSKGENNFSIKNKFYEVELGFDG